MIPNWETHKEPLAAALYLWTWWMMLVAQGTLMARWYLVQRGFPL